MQQTARTLADQVVAYRQDAWDEQDSSVAIAATEQLNPEDATLVNRIVEDAGFCGAEGVSMAKKVKSLVVGQVEARIDNSPSESG